MEEKRYIGIDYGGRRVGIAVSDLSGTLASSLETLTVSDDNDARGKIMSLIDEYNPIGIVIGLPLNLSGDESELSQRVREFVRILESETSVPIILEDERLSSRMAENILHSHGKKVKGNKGKIDRISAAIILQSFLDRQQSGNV